MNAQNVAGSYQCPIKCAFGRRFSSELAKACAKNNDVVFSMWINDSDFYLRIIAAVLCALCLVIATHGIFIAHDYDGSAAIGGFSVLNFVIAVAAHRRLKRKAKEIETLLAELSALRYEQALVKARGTSVSMPAGIVRHKVRNVAGRWQAFEKDSVQYVVIQDEHSGRTKAERI